MLGLKRHAVHLVAHRPEWASAFEAEAAVLRAGIADIVIDIQHVGSTAIAGLPAKPILDVAIAVGTLDVIPKVAERLRERGYIDRGDGRDGGYLLVKESGLDIRTVHVHIVEVTDSQWRDYITFREVLRRDPHTRGRYADVKQALADRYRHDRTAYTAGKAAFIRAVLRRCDK